MDGFPCLAVSPPCGASLARFIRGPLPPPENLVADLARVTDASVHSELFDVLLKVSASSDELFELLQAYVPLDSLPLLFDIVASRSAVRDRLLDVDQPLTPDVWPFLQAADVDFAPDAPPTLIPPDRTVRARNDDATGGDDPAVVETAVAEAMRAFFELGNDVMLLALTALSRPAADAQMDLLEVLGDSHLDTVTTCLTHSSKMKAALAAAVRSEDPATAAAAAAAGGANARTAVLGGGGPTLGGVTVTLPSGGKKAKTKGGRAVAAQDKALAAVLAAAGGGSGASKQRAEEEEAERAHAAQLVAEAGDPTNLPANYAQIKNYWKGGGDAIAAAAAAAAASAHSGVGFATLTLKDSVPPSATHTVVNNNEWVTIPPPPRFEPPSSFRQVPISDLPTWATCAFNGIKYLNVIQSTVFETVFTTSHNMLVCAPTGAGKTNVALLAVLREIGASCGVMDRHSTSAPAAAFEGDESDDGGSVVSLRDQVAKARQGGDLLTSDSDADVEGDGEVGREDERAGGRGIQSSDVRLAGGGGGDGDDGDDGDGYGALQSGVGGAKSATVSCLGPGAARAAQRRGSHGAAGGEVDAASAAAAAAALNVKLEGKIVYVAPMKALATEVQDGFTKRLQSYGLTVREVTGDTEVSRAELESSSVIVTTPEKFDLMTRKPTYETFVRQVTLMLVDEVHFLHDERGAVLEAIVGRLHRLAEQQQRTIRFVAMSATLPNPLDVARFLGVTPNVGLFIFPPNFRPVPLKVEMVGLKPATSGRGGMRMNETAADQVAFEKAAAHAREGQSVMVFVHSRKQTVTMLQKFSALDSKGVFPFSPRHHPGAAPKSAYGAGKGGKAPVGMTTGEAERLLDKRRSAIMRASLHELRTSIMNGMACHHAGMVRSDRLLVESLFREGLIRLVVCTATLAWGVNLPAHAVIIRGTDVFKSESGSSDLDILDVLQIFGRAGRPQYDDEGEAMLITHTPKLPQYLRIFHDQLPIESRLVRALPDHLNAEVVLGSVNSVEGGMQWLGHSFWFVRAQRMPHHYGLTPTDVANDPQLGAMRRKRIEDAAAALDKARMARFDPNSGVLAATELGRIAAHYYVSVETMNVWSRDETLLACQNLGHCVRLLANSGEFATMRVRDDEEETLQAIAKDIRYPPRDSRGDDAVRPPDWKVSILLQFWIGAKGELHTHSLKCEVQYVAKQAPRLAAALHQVCLYRGMKTQAILFHQLNLAIEKRFWPHQHPLRQFNREIPDFLFARLESAKCGVQRLLQMSPGEIGSLVQNSRQGPTVKYLAERVPTFESDVEIAPITPTILRVTFSLLPSWKFDAKYHAPCVSGTLIVGDTESDHIYHTDHVRFEKQQIQGGEPLVLMFNIGALSVRTTGGAQGCLMPSHYTFTLLIHRWAGVTHKHVFSTRSLIVPQSSLPYTELAKLPPLPTGVLPSKFAKAFSFPFFNPIQTMIFFSAFQTDKNLLVGAPTGSGKTVAADLAVLRMVLQQPGCKAVYVAPLKSLVRERIDDWSARLGPAGVRLVELTGEASPDPAEVEAADVIVTVPEKWDGVTRGAELRRYVKQVKLIIFDEVHVLGTERGAILEAILARVRRSDARAAASAKVKKLAPPVPTRVVAMSTAVANASDLATWLGVKHDDVFNFKPHIRPVPVEVHVKSFPGEHYCPRMETMNGPAFQAIQDHSAAKPTLIFVSSRRQTRITGLALRQRILATGRGTFAVPSELRKGATAGTGDAVAASRRHSEPQDPALAELLPFGIGIHHAGMSVADRRLVEDGFRDGTVGVLVATSTLAWGVNLPAHLVILKGTEYFDKNTCQYVDYDVTDVLQMMGRAGRPQYDNSAVACIFVHEPKKPFFKKFLYEPFPVESLLHKDLPPHINAEVASGSIRTRGEIIEYLTHTYLFRRIPQNPSYYGVPLEGVDANEDARKQAILKHIAKTVDDVIVDLYSHKCLTTHCLQEGEDGGLASGLEGEMGGTDRSNIRLKPTALGRIAAYYYLRPETISKFDAEIQPDATSADLLVTLCRAAEFGLVPVRHNEDITNEELAVQIKSVDLGEQAGGEDEDGELLAPCWDSLGLAPSPHEAPSVFAFGAMGSGNTKALLLLMAHIQRGPLPIADYYTDQKSVLDNAARIVQALVDVACDKRFLCAAVRAMRLAPVVTLGRRLDEHPLAFTGAPASLQRAVALEGTLADALYERQATIDLLRSAAAKSGDRVAVPKHVLDKVISAVERVPLYTVRTSVRLDHAAAGVGMTAAGRVSHIAHVEVDVVCLSGNAFAQVGTSHAKAGQMPGGWVMVGDTEADEVLAVGRFTPRVNVAGAARRPQGADNAAAEGRVVGKVRLAFGWLPDAFQKGESLRVFFISDSFVGLDVCEEAPFGEACKEVNV